jgi:hypothetical protein
MPASSCCSVRTSLTDRTKLKNARRSIEDIEW